MSKKTIPRLVMLISFLLIGPFMRAQVVIDNQTSCEYLVKVNILKKGSCRLLGEGPLLRVLANQKLKLPTVPKSSWIVGYGIEEEGESLEKAVIVGNPSCNFRSIIKVYGSCKAAIKYTDERLTIVEGD